MKEDVVFLQTWPNDPSVRRHNQDLNAVEDRLCKVRTR